MLSTNCYPPNVLENYLNGRIDDELNEAIEQHLQACEVCEDTVTELDSIDDTLVRTLQLKGNATQPTPDWLKRIVELDPKTDTQPTVDDSPGIDQPQRFGDYELAGTLGRGGMSIVFAARHKHLGRDVALKVLLPTSQQHSLSRERFSREMLVIGGLTHPSIIRATDAGEFEDTLYLVMDQIDGADLKNISRSEGPLSVANVCAIGVQVAQGLHHAHSQGVIHRDIKPSNLMLDRNGHVKILDFGLARIQSAAQDVTLQTTIGQLLGTLDYMAPEQANGSEVGPEADIYALGATIFKLLTGVAPHGRSADVPIIEFLQRLANDPAPRVTTKREQIPDRLSELIDRMLRTHPDERESSALAIAEQLADFTSGADLSKLIDRVPNRLLPITEFPLHDSDQSIQAAQSASIDRPKVTASDNRTPFGPIAWALAAAGMFGIVLLALAMTLKSPEGEFRIESDVLDSFTVEVVGENDRVDLVAVDQGAASTTLRAGRYQIRLDRPSDSITVTPNEVTVSKDEVAIVKITRVKSKKQSVAAGVGKSVRDPRVALSAQIELLETIDELQATKQQENPDDSKIEALQQKVVSLRALSQPIPAEPVYKGRTLADWTAQMRFEQDSDSRKLAASSVLRLTRTLPRNEMLTLAFEARARLASWVNPRMDDAIYDAIKPAQIASLHDGESADRIISSKLYATQLQSDNPLFRNYSITRCMNAKKRNT